MIYSINIKTNIMFDVMKSFFNLTSDQMFIEASHCFNSFDLLLQTAKIDYKKLRNVLVPNSKKKEICLVFDTLNIKECRYGIKILNDLLPFFDKTKSYNVLFGDLLDYTGCKYTNQILDVMCEACNIPRVDEQRYTNRYFLVYINNLSKEDFRQFADCVKSLKYLIGYADMTYSGIFKSYISNCINGKFIILNGKAICAHEPDIEGVRHLNTPGLDFENYGYEIISISSDYYSLFLDYLIDSSVSVWKTDLKYKELLSDIIGHDCDLQSFSIDISEAKLAYFIQHSNLARRLGDPSDLKNTIQEVVSSSIKRNVLYEISFDKLTYNIVQFSVYADLDYSSKIKCVVKYDIIRKKYELITIY